MPEMAQAALSLSRADGSPMDLLSPFVAAVGVLHVSISTMGTLFGTETLAATDEHAASWNELQIDLGEGPIWEAHNTHRPLFEPDVQAAGNTRWPVADAALRSTGLGAVFAFPLAVAALDIGVVAIYAESRGHLTHKQVTDAALLAQILARKVLHRGLAADEGRDLDSAVWEGDYSRREVHQATGMVLAQLKTTAEDALLVLRGHAFATGRPLRDIANDVIARTLDFTDPDYSPRI